MKFKNPFKGKDKSKGEAEAEATAPPPAEEAPKEDDPSEKEALKQEQPRPSGTVRGAKSAPVTPDKAPEADTTPKSASPDSAGGIENLGNANSYEAKSEEEAFADNLPTVKAKDADTHTEFPRFVYHEYKCAGTFEFRSKGKEIHKKGKSITKAIQEFKANPQKWIAMTFQANSKGWPTKEQEYYMIERKGSSQLHPKGVSDDGWMAVLLQDYQHLPPFPNNEFPVEFRDDYTDNMTHKGVQLHTDEFKPVCPGRGQGCADSPLIKIIGDIDPSDVVQGQVGCCWLLSAISALAEFDGAVKHLFRKTPNIDKMPLPGPNQYTISLWDLPTWTEVDIVIDERLAANPNTTFSTSTVLSSKPSEDGELWVCYLEKAIAVHCGGWDAVSGGQCTHAWAIMTGCKEQFIILRNAQTNKWGCHARYNPHTKQWLNHENDVHKCDNVTGVWPVPFPVVGDSSTDTGDTNHQMTDDELFLKMYACDQMNYIVGAGSKGGGTDDGLVDNHAYTVIEVVKDAAGTGIDMFKVRNPWGKGEIEDGEFDDDGPGWEKYPQIKALLNPVVADDGIFWLTKEEFFEFFKSVYISASNMTEFLED